MSNIPSLSFFTMCAMPLYDDVVCKIGKMILAHYSLDVGQNQLKKCVVQKSQRPLAEFDVCGHALTYSVTKCKPRFFHEKPPRTF